MNNMVLTKFLLIQKYVGMYSQTIYMTSTITLNGFGYRSVDIGYVYMKMKPNGGRSVIMKTFVRSTLSPHTLQALSQMTPAKAHNLISKSEGLIKDELVIAVINVRGKLNRRFKG